MARQLIASYSTQAGVPWLMALHVVLNVCYTDRAAAGRHGAVIHVSMLAQCQLALQCHAPPFPTLLKPKPCFPLPLNLNMVETGSLSQCEGQKSHVALLYLAPHSNPTRSTDAHMLCTELPLSRRNLQVTLLIVITSLTFYLYTVGPRTLMHQLF